ncbi:hypothetical protein [Chryseobacterium indoltheticum]|uniref:Uncharacterized protein n=1 Tax=Chryseobacterium indoltheticum TaxID=254 RepID=A0A381F727_9FLAO|nr:hypothetical protein [Chryseobacterium indoltheticum]AZA72359.1 hypothetical protein EG358_00645 [Chryseobacterium indoltheticum]SIR11290.1 hypothetical protein SAMN05421682_112158 [Chryseobacterium indoltheticum]SUX41922.1 Uncharacterised protein [Chryseobacterium indoltheticum]
MKDYLFLILLLLISCKKNEARKEIIQKDETLDLKYEVLNQLITDQIREDSINDILHDNIYNIAVKRIFFEELNENEPPPPPVLALNFSYDSIFAMKDSSYYKNQDRNLINFNLQKSRIKNKLDFVTTDEILNLSIKYERNFWKQFRKKYGDKCIQTFSVPFFNKNKTVCIVQNSMSCGPLYGGGSTSIYKKVNGKWVVLRTFDQWVS